MIVTTYVDYDVGYRKKGTRKKESATLVEQVHLEIQDLTSADHPVVVWSPVEAKGSRDDYVFDGLSMKVGVRKDGDDFLVPVLRGAEKGTGIDPEFAKGWKGRTLRAISGEIDVVRSGDLDDRRYTVPAQSWGHLERPNRRFPNWGRSNSMLDRLSEVSYVGDLHSSDLEARRSQLAETLSTRFVVVDDVLHERVGPLLAFREYATWRWKSLREMADVEDTLEKAVAAIPLWSDSAQKKLRDDTEKSYRREQILNSLKSIVVDADAVAFDPVIDVAPIVARSVLAHASQSCFLHGRPEFLRGVVRLRDDLNEGVDVVPALQGLLDRCGRVPDEWEERRSIPTIEVDVLRRLATFIDRLPVPSSMPKPKREPAP